VTNCFSKDHPVFQLEGCLFMSASGRYITYNLVNIFLIWSSLCDVLN